MTNQDLINQMKTVIFVTSSTGDGDAPDNAVEFYKQVRDAASLSHIRFALLGLGDSNYTTFLGFPKDFKKALEDKGAKSFYASGWADDAVGLETVVDPWIEGLWPALDRHLKGEEEEEGTIELPEDMKPFGVIDEEPQKPIEGIEKEVQIVEDPKLTNGTGGKLFEKEKSFEELVSTDGHKDEKHNEQASRPTIYISRDLSGRTLKIPALPREKFHIEFLENDIFVQFDAKSLKQLPSAAGPLVNLPVNKARMLTTFDADKIAIEVTLDKNGNDLPCEPGDSIGIVCPNDPSEVAHILRRLEVENVSNKILQICGEARDIPSHFPERASLTSLLSYHCDIRSSPKKALLRIMAEYAQNEDEKRRLLELSSVEGAVEYTKLIKEANISLLDILETFKSSLPPIEKVLQQLPKMLPRAYSIVTSKLKDPDHLAFVFKIVEFPATDGRTRERKGVATGWISQLTSPLWKRANVEEQLGNLNLESIQLPIYQRTSTAFRLPQQLDTPIIMVGPGSGVAPFLGFLHQREELIKANPSQIVGASWLFFGCRHENKDYLYRSELERLHGSGVLTRFYQAFSKEPSTGPRYVQDILRLYKRPLVTLLLDRGAVFYVCGDAKGMAKDVFETLADAIAEVKGLDIQDARATTAKLQLEKRYLQDVWS